VKILVTRPTKVVKYVGLCLVSRAFPALGF
jgi:hypothetical protein